MYVRKNGWVELAEYPGPNIIAKQQLVTGEIASKKTLHVEIDDEQFRAAIDDRHLDYGLLRIQSQGAIEMAAWRSNVVFSNVRVVSHDTLNVY